MTVKWGEMKWNSWNFSETRPWEPTKDLLNSIKSVLVQLPIFQTYRSFSSSQRPTHRPHQPQESRHLHECTHTYQLLWIPTMECLGLRWDPWYQATGHRSPGTWSQGIFLFYFIFYFGGRSFFSQKNEKNIVFSLFFLSFSLSFSLSRYTNFMFFWV